MVNNFLLSRNPIFDEAYISGVKNKWWAFLPFF